MTPQPLPPSTVHRFKAGLRGDLIQAGDAEYENGRRVYNGMIDKRPALIARCCDVVDVMLAVNFAREHGLLLAVRGGGHNGGGLGTCDDGLVIDLARLRGIRVDPAQRTVRVEGGCTWGDVDHATHVFGLATPSGPCFPRCIFTRLMALPIALATATQPLVIAMPNGRR